MLPFMAECAFHIPHGHGGWRAALSCLAIQALVQASECADYQQSHMILAAH